MIATKWILSMLGLYAHRPLVVDRRAVDLEPVRSAAKHQAHVSAHVTKSTLDAMEIQSHDKRPEQLAKAVEKLPSATHDTIAKMLGRVR